VSVARPHSIKAQTLNLVTIIGPDRNPFA